MNHVDKMLGTSAPAKPAARRSSSRRPAAAGHPGRGDRVRRQADEEAPTDDGRREEGGFRADDSLLGRAQKESREVASPPRGASSQSSTRAASWPGWGAYAPIRPRESRSGRGAGYRTQGAGARGPRRGQQVRVRDSAGRARQPPHRRLVAPPGQPPRVRPGRVVAVRRFAGAGREQPAAAESP